MADIIIHDEDLRKLRGKVIVVTGGSSGTGLATVELLLALGAAVVSGDAQPPPAPQVIYPSEGSAAFFTYVPTDIRVWGDLVQLFRRAIKVHGRVDHVFASAGFPSLDDCFSSLSLDADGELQEPSHAVLDVNLKGTINTAALAIHHMLTQDPPGGSIVLNSSITNPQRSDGVAHAVSENGILGFSRGLKSNLSTSGLPIRVNVLMLGKISDNVVSGTAVARGAAHLMADITRHGHVVYVDNGRYREIEEAVILPAYRSIIGESEADDDAL
ncbi:hypothetical protein PG984_005084 [Apiospora sp. TS-2023a]